MWFVCLLQFARMLVQNCQALLPMQLASAASRTCHILPSRKSRTLPVQKWHLLLLCEEALLHVADCLFSFPTELNRRLSPREKKKKNLVSNTSVSKWLLSCESALSFTSCLLPACTNKLTEACVRMSTVAVWVFFLNFSSAVLAQTFFFFFFLGLERAISELVRISQEACLTCLTPVQIYVPYPGNQAHQNPLELRYTSPYMTKKAANPYIRRLGNTSSVALLFFFLGLQKWLKLWVHSANILTSRWIHLSIHTRFVRAPQSRAVGQ